MYHVSPHTGITTLKPSMPAEDIYGGRLVWHDDTALLPGSECVCLQTGSLAHNLQYNPLVKGFIYTPTRDDHEVRHFDNEARRCGEWLDSAVVGEKRIYRAVPVTCVGTVDMIVYRGRLLHIVVWY